MGTRPEGHDTVVSKGPCPKCGSKDNNVTYADGHEHCFSPGCDHWKPAEGEAEDKTRGANKASATSADLLDPSSNPRAFDRLTKRGIEAETLRKYGVFSHGYSGQPVQVYPYFTLDGEPCAQKLRFPDKTFSVLKAASYPGSLAQCQLFGRHVYGDRFDRQVIVVEGEVDALTVAQVQGFKVAVVSVNTGAQSAEKCLKANYLWLDRFKEIILWFDNDEAGKLATEECAKLFAVGKVRIATATGLKADKSGPCKDASDMLQANRPGDIISAVYAATAWRPKGIVNASANVKDVLAPREKVLAWSYPPVMERLQDMTNGMHPGEVIYHVAGTGVGKSTALREIQYHLLEQGAKIAVLSFEDTVRDMKFGLMSIAANERLHLVPVPELEDEDGLAAYDKRMTAIHAQVFGGGKVELFDPETAEWSMDAILGYIRYCAKALDCQVLFVDPISFVAAGIELTADERRVLDKVAGEFAKLAKELGIHLQISHHLKRTSGVPHEEGAPTSLNELRSSGGLANFAMGVIGWERNNQAEGEAWRVTQSRIIKPVRRTGKSGLADVLYYTEEGRLIKSPISFPPIGKPEGGDGGGGRQRGFAPVSNSEDY